MGQAGRCVKLQLFDVGLLGDIELGGHVNKNMGYNILHCPSKPILRPIRPGDI